jgi:4-hydroxybenzoate polyprenyltransferase
MKDKTQGSLSLGFREAMLAYLQLVRLPTVFTAMADIFLGFILTHRSLQPVDKFIGLLCASCGLYLAGMVFNDVFDRKQDAEERPGRPIPSGRVPVTAAVILGTVLMVLGVAAATTVNYWSPGVAVVLAMVILAYDGWFKRTVLGPLFMGSCRFLNAMLGASDFTWHQELFFRSPPQLVCAIGLGIYIVGVTWFARTEAKQSRRGHLLGALGVLDAGVLVLAGLIVTWPVRLSFSWPDEQVAISALLLLLLIVGQLNYRAWSAIRDPSPARVQPVIKQMLLSYVMVDAALIFWHTGDGALAFATACLVIPAMFLGRYIPMT